jgi:hydrogenase expression/formation protein HypE
MKGPVIHIINTDQMDEYVSMNHGSGGSLTGKLIRDVFIKRFGTTEPLTDSAIIKESGLILAFTTDSYVVDPIFFPGGDIGKLSVCGTVNDLAVSGAIPQYISASFIIEEGFPVKDLIIITDSMSAEAEKAGVRIVAGDTKVVEKGKCDKIFITTSGIGILKPEFEHISTATKVKPGDKLLINGPIGNHSIAVLGARNEMGFSSPVDSDCASLNHLIRKVLDECKGVHFMRDLTRGGLATVLNELTHMISSGIVLNESSVPVEEPVKGLCEMLGFDPLYLANEGRVIIVAADKEHEKILGVMRSSSLGKNAELIGEVVETNRNLVVLNTLAGGRRILDIPSGMQLPRIC